MQLSGGPLFPSSPLEKPSQQPVPWGLADVSLALVVMVLIAVMLVLPAGAVAEAIAGDMDVEKDPEALAVLLGANLGLEAALLGAAYLFSVAKYKVSWGALGFRRPKKGGLWLPLVVLGLAWVIMGSYFGIAEAVLPEVLVPKEGSIPDAAFDSATVLPIAVLLAIVFAPLMEETFFRGFIFNALRGRWGVVASAVVSGLLFGSLHFQVATIIPFTAIGVLFAFAYVYSGSLIASISAHLMFNGVSVIFAVSGG